MKWIIRLIGVVVAVVVVLIGALFLLPTERLAKIATDRLSQSLGREVAILGDVSISIWPVLGVAADDIRVANADWSASGPMFEAQSAAIGVNAGALLGGEVRITKVEAQSPVIRLEQKEDGRANWQFGGAVGANDPDDAQADSTETVQNAGNDAGATTNTFSLARLEVTNATLIYDVEGEAPVSLSGADFSIDWPDPRGPAEIAARIRPADEEIVVNIAIDAMADFLGGEVSALRATAAAGAGQIMVDGRASTNGAVAAAVSATLPDTDAFLAALGLPAAGLSPNLGQSIAATADVTLTPDMQLSLRQMRLDLDENLITGDADVTLQAVPQINARLDVGDLDLSGSEEASETGGSGASGGSASSSVKDEGWPKTPIDASALSSFNGDIALTANSIDLGQFTLGATQAVLRNDSARMVFDLQQVEAYGGTVAGEFVANNRSGLSVGGQLTVSDMQMQPLLSDAIDLDRLTGRGDLSFSFLGSGDTVNAIMRSLSGDGRLQIDQGTVQGIDLDKLLRGSMTSGTTVFDQLTATWTIASGVLTNDDLLMQLKNYEVSGAGTVGLGSRTVNYRVTPVALRANSGQGLSIPVDFKGPWSDISIRPDVEAALDARLDEEKDALEEKAKQKLSDELGVSGDSGKSIEDEVKDRLLRKLFD